MTSVQFLNSEKYGEAYWYCRLHLSLNEWYVDFNHHYRINFINPETATFIKLRYA